MAVKTRHTLSLSEDTFAGLKALSSLAKKSISSFTEEVLKEKIESETKKNPFLKLEMADIGYVEIEEQKEIEQILSSLTPEDLAPAGEIVRDPITGKASLRSFK